VQATRVAERAGSVSTRGRLLYVTHGRGLIPDGCKDKNGLISTDSSPKAVKLNTHRLMVRGLRLRGAVPLHHHTSS
jgi:hypothetical protein